MRNGVDILIKKVLTIAGSDCSGGAGIQADIKTITAHKMYAMSAITALTAQNTMGVYDVMDATPEFVGKEIDCIFEDIVPDAVKIGMVSNSGIIDMIALKLQQYNAKNIVVDPVMVSTSGGKLLSDEAMSALINRLLPLGNIITPNIPEAAALCGFSIADKNDMVKAAEKISQNIKGAVLVKGGHLDDTADDLLYNQGEIIWLKGEKIDNPNTHGTGCTLSSAIACNLAAGFDMVTAVTNAKAYITGALAAGLDLGHGSGPLEHTFNVVLKK